MQINRRVLVAGALAASICPASVMARGNSSSTSVTDQTYANEMSSAYDRNVPPSQINRAAKKYFSEPRFAGYRGVSKLKNHYHNHWARDSYFERGHIYNCPCCFLLLFELSRGSEIYIREFFRRYRGRNRFNWHYRVQWNQFGPTRSYSLEPYARLARLDRYGEVIDYSEAGFAYYEDGEQRVINFDGAEAFDFTSSRYGPNGEVTVPTWLDRP